MPIDAAVSTLLITLAPTLADVAPTQASNQTLVAPAEAAEVVPTFSLHDDSPQIVEADIPLDAPRLQRGTLEGWPRRTVQYFPSTIGH